MRWGVGGRRGGVRWTAIVAPLAARDRRSICWGRENQAQHRRRYRLDRPARVPRRGPRREWWRGLLGKLPARFDRGLRHARKTSRKMRRKRKERSGRSRTETNRCARKRVLAQRLANCSAARPRNCEAVLQVFSRRGLSTNCASPMPGTVSQLGQLHDAWVARAVLPARSLWRLLSKRMKKNRGDGPGSSAGR